MPVTSKVIPWRDSNPSVLRWWNKKALRSQGTANVYLGDLYLYWRDRLIRLHRSIDEWLQSVKEQQESKDYNVKTTWATELEEFFLTYIGVRKHGPLSEKKRRNIAAAVSSFLQHALGRGQVAEYDFTFVSRDQAVEEARKRRELAPMTLDDLRALYKACQKTRDKAAILTLLNGGLGVSEFVQFSKDWFRYEVQIRRREAPLKIDLVRHKSSVSYWTLLWDDAVDTLADLLKERERQVGRKLSKSDRLFVSGNNTQMNTIQVQQMFRLVADRAGIDPKANGEFKQIYRVRPHECRDTLRTLCSNKGVESDVAEFILGHTVDPLFYNKFPDTEEGKQRIYRELEKVRPYLNFLTGRGKPVSIQTGQSYYEHWRDFAIMGHPEIDPEDIDRLATEILSKSEDFRRRYMQLIQHGKVRAEGVVEEVLDNPPLAISLEIAQSMPREQLLPSLIQVSKKLNAKPKVRQEIIEDSQVSEYLNQGWRFVAPFNGRHAIVEREDPTITDQQPYVGKPREPEDEVAKALRRWLDGES